MSVFRLPKSLCAEFSSMCANFWWGKKNNCRGIHWVKWRSLSCPKMDGGSGFWDFVNFIHALLAKQCWCILSNPGSLVSQVYLGHYFPNEFFLKASQG